MAYTSVIAPFIERRLKPRMKCNYPVMLQSHDRLGKKFMEEGRVVNLSRSGIFVLMKRTIPDGNPVSVRIAMPTGYLEFGTAKLTTNGTVVRCEPCSDGSYGVAITFERYRMQ